MRYRFEMEAFTGAEKLSRDERYDIMQYVSSVRMEEEDEEQACRRLGEMANGRYSWNGEGRMANIMLPDYDNCVLVVRAVESEISGR